MMFIKRLSRRLASQYAAITHRKKEQRKRSGYHILPNRHVTVILLPFRHSTLKVQFMSQFRTAKNSSRLVPSCNDFVASSRERHLGAKDSGSAENWIRPGYYLIQLRLHHRN